MQLKVSTSTTIGPRQTNQDRLYADIKSIDGCNLGAFCVADGMGGLDNGDYASTVAIEAVEDWWKSFMPKGDGVLNELEQLIFKMNSQIIQYSKVKGLKIGTTCSILILSDSSYYIAHVGDSRIYIASRKVFKKQLISQITTDHVNPNNNRLTSCIGVFDYPSIHMTSDLLTGNGRFILCSDGIYSVVNRQEIAKMSPDQLVKKALKRNTTDNASVIVVEFKGASGSIAYPLPTEVITEQL